MTDILLDLKRGAVAPIGLSEREGAVVPKAEFYVECGLHGARLMSTSLDLTPNCLGDEIDTHIQQLKDELDVCAREMKRRVGELRQRGSFSGSRRRPRA